MLVLTPSEKSGMLKMMKNRKPPVNLDLWEVNKEQTSDITPKLRALCVEREEKKGFASRAFVAYAKHVHLQKVQQGKILWALSEFYDRIWLKQGRVLSRPKTWVPITQRL